MQLSRKSSSPAPEPQMMLLVKPLTLRTWTLDLHLSAYSPERIQRMRRRPRKPETETELMRESVQAVKGITADVKGMTQVFRRLALQAQHNHGGHRPALLTIFHSAVNVAGNLKDTQAKIARCSPHITTRMPTTSTHGRSQQRC